MRLSSDFHMCSCSHLSASDSDRPKTTLLAHQASTSGCAPYDAPQQFVQCISTQHRLLHISYHQIRILAPPHSCEVAPATFGIMWTGGLQAQAPVSVDVKLLSFTA